MSGPLVYLNGNLVPAREARVSVFDHGLLYGHGLFETMRAYQGRVFRLEPHLVRLIRGAEVAGISLDGRMRELDEAVAAAIGANGLSDARVRLTVTAGEGPGRPVVSMPSEPTVLAVASPLEPVARETYARGYRVVVASHPYHGASKVGSIKSISFLENLLANAEAKSAGADEAVLLNDRGLVAEGSLSNIFIVTQGRLLTPALDCGPLPGITRDAVLETARYCGVPSEETWIDVDGLGRADEVFVTNSVLEIMPVTEIDTCLVGDGVPGVVTRALMTAYRDLVFRELELASS